MASQLLLSQVTQMCFLRILSRLRSKHAPRTQKTKDRPPLPAHLLKTISQCHDEALVANARVFPTLRQQCIALNDAFQILEDSAESDDKTRHVECIIALAKQIDLQTLATALGQSREVHSCLREYMPRALQKLGRYLDIARGLVNAARTTQHALFQRIVVLPVEPPEWSTGNHTPPIANQQFESVWSRAAATIPRNRSQGPHQQAKKKYEARILSCPVKWKVHAEIQLLLFYERQPRDRRPRAICSSKSACYLCDLFIGLHGSFFVPRTHGRIYDRWTLPAQATLGLQDTSRLVSVLQKFNVALESVIRQAIMSKHEKRAPPVESVVGLVEPWSSHSTIVPKQPSAPCLATPETVTAIGASGYKPASPGSGPSKQPTAKVSSSSVSTTLRIGDSNHRTWLLEEGEQICERVRPGDRVSIRTSTIHVELSSAGDGSIDKNGFPSDRQACQVEVKYLPSDSEIGPNAHIVDVSSINFGEDLNFALRRPWMTGQVVCCSRLKRLCVVFRRLGKDC